MRCGGCGAKLGADLLRRVLESPSRSKRRPPTVRGIGDDAAVVQVRAGNMAMSCDGFRAMRSTTPTASAASAPITH